MSDRIKPSPPDFSTWNFVDSSLLHVKLKGGDTVVYKSAEKDNRTWFVVVNSYAHPLQPARGVEFNFFDRGVVMKGWGLADDEDDFEKMSKAVLTDGRWRILLRGESVSTDFLYHEDSLELAAVAIKIYDDKDKFKFEVIIKR
ncbi:MAG: hypothetical protein A2745_01795 [Candidatus Harrisonbacteria bacterium RIFCSPHIGHO2_01_FULL_44_13]|uniref:Uncharacterized protein n=1 Tax=Candidatus Harrisonbacteria bacterium RIFCSPLOWO2_01_FULL_44_18 TaxID=1798407 RepID=A0A1G1ZM68_9BACT|nr:MAG: hypothetical protein A2745_01795 [Candidatus Harrisonbacteria bacterium RIFCSPHIGHO2_01_FULL_44_13]OGY65206.1 MAG: hypothetical protein A3A16_00755 [Candidatus Harrisonbacteria bacterium RIFCSPLOWO2_01_FULL_44_18]